MTDFATRYGPWALIAGGAQGIGAAYSHYAAARGLNVIALDVARAPLAQLAACIEEEHGVACLPLEIDLAAEDMLDTVIDAVGERHIGLLIYNAGLADVGAFYKPDTGLDFELRKIAVNVSAPMALTYHLARPMLARGRGGIVLMSSGAGLQGSPYYAHYSATKAYNIALAEALHMEFEPYGVDVLACIAGMTLSSVAEIYKDMDASTLQTPEQLVAETMAALGKGATVIAGEAHRRGRAFLQQLPREQQVEFVARHAVDNFFGGVAPDQNLENMTRDTDQSKHSED